MLMNTIIVQKYFSVTNTEFNSLLMPDETMLNVVIKGLSSELTETEIFNELNSTGYDVKGIRQFANCNTKFLINRLHKSQIHSSNAFLTNTHCFTFQ